MTEQGTLLGTLQCMAPEQVEGKVDEIDSRTDIFAFGAVVYEMATGKKAFDGQTQASVIAKILEVDPPPMSTLQPIVPPMLDRVVKRCLAKDRNERWQTAYDLWQDIRWIKEGGAQAAVLGGAEGSASLPARRKLRERASWIAATVFFVGFLALLLPAIRDFLRPPEGASPVRFLAETPPFVQYFSLSFSLRSRPTGVTWHSWLLSMACSIFGYACSIPFWHARCRGARVPLNCSGRRTVVFSDFWPVQV